MSTQSQGSSQVKDRIELHDPDLYDVILLNDDFTTMDFVVSVLMQVFYRSSQEAETIMMSVHKTGSGVAGTYTLDIAKSKVIQATIWARKEDFPLRLKIKEHI